MEILSPATVQIFRLLLTLLVLGSLGGPQLTATGLLRDSLTASDRRSRLSAAFIPSRGTSPSHLPALEPLLRRRAAADELYRLPQIPQTPHLSHRLPLLSRLSSQLESDGGSTDRADVSRFDPDHRWEGAFADTPILTLSGNLVDTRRTVMRDFLEYMGIPTVYLGDLQDTFDAHTDRLRWSANAADEQASNIWRAAQEDFLRKGFRLQPNQPIAGPPWPQQQPQAVPQLRILLLGGDGTVGWAYETLHRLFDGTGYFPLVAVMPCGTYNDIGRLSGMQVRLSARDCSMGELPKIVNYVLNCNQVYDLDVWRLIPEGMTDLENFHSNYSVHSVAMGFIARSLFDFEKWRSTHPEAGRLYRKAFIWASGLLKYIQNDALQDVVRLTYDTEDGRHEANASLPGAFSCFQAHNIPIYGGSPFLSPDYASSQKVVQDGLLDVTVHSKPQMFGQLVLNTQGRHELSRLRDLTIDVPPGRRTFWMIDGTACSAVGGQLHVQKAGQMTLLTGPRLHHQSQSTSATKQGRRVALPPSYDHAQTPVDDTALPYKVRSVSPVIDEDTVRRLDAFLLPSPTIPSAFAVSEVVPQPPAEASAHGQEMVQLA
ncbi:unnamed protein product [Vitrella brassicaformis CCMP3155]|uniref:DAGKc domain-containing protein n=2 Tax=Vitrella brassicaformis TaxID=1169539 RepID=A0A0G4EHD4_VITBC|nr:unnamed protein product [Vitrella brassicaformis CCMP3155]|eukprot:CEL95102.1 unnamed protein product [Vitrella brassicaformis CCMP3155]